MPCPPRPASRSFAPLIWTVRLTYRRSTYGVPDTCKTSSDDQQPSDMNVMARGADRSAARIPWMHRMGSACDKMPQRAR